MGTLDYLKELEGRILDAASYKRLQRNYEMQEENIKQLKDRIESLESQNSDHRAKNDEISRENIKLKEENRILKEQISLDIQKPQLKDGHYYFSEDGPYCTACWDKGKKKVRLSEMTEAFRDFGTYKCPVCHAKYK